MSKYSDTDAFSEDSNWGGRFWYDSHSGCPMYNIHDSSCENPQFESHDLSTPYQHYEENVIYLSEPEQSVSAYISIVN